MAETRRIGMYTHDSFGLGHAQRVVHLARELAARSPLVRTLGLLGSMTIDADRLPPRFDYVKLPAADKAAIYPAPGALDRTRNVRGSRGDVMLGLRRTLIAETLTAFAPRLLLVDHLPAGLQRELLPALNQLTAMTPRPRLVAGLRDVASDPRSILQSWERGGTYQLLEEVYDLVLIYGSQEVYDPIREYGFSSRLAAKTIFCGYIRPDPPTIDAATLRARLSLTAETPLIVVAVGGGLDGGRVVEAAIGAIQSERLDGAFGVIVTGPQLDLDEYHRLIAAAAGSSRIKLLRGDPELVSWFAAADAVVTMGGYNSLAEVVALGKRCVAVPRVKPELEQSVRARRFQELGLISSTIHPRLLDADRLARALRTALDGPPPTGTLDFGGTKRAGDELLRLLDLTI